MVYLKGLKDFMGRYDLIIWQRRRDSNPRLLSQNFASNEKILAIKSL